MMDSRLKRWLHILAGVACAAASLACAVAAWRGTETIEGFRADAEVKDVGVLKQQDEKDVIFRLTNATEAPVEITQVSTSCTCTRAEVAARNLQPGESTELTARLRVGSRRGQVTAHIDVVYRFGGEQRLERLVLEIKAIAEPHYTVIPEEIVFARNGDGETASKREASITITPKNGPALRILDASATHPSIQVTKIHPGATAGSTTINIDFAAARCIATTVRAELVIRTDSKMEPIHRVPVRVVSKYVH